MVLVGFESRPARRASSKFDVADQVSDAKLHGDVEVLHVFEALAKYNASAPNQRNVWHIHPALVFQGRTMPPPNTMRGIFARMPVIVTDYSQNKCSHT